MPESPKKSFWEPAIQIFASVSVWIAGPIIVALFVGKWLDKKYESEPWLFLASIGSAFIISSYGIVRLTMNYLKKLDKELQEQKQQEQDKQLK